MVTDNQERILQKLEELSDRIQRIKNAEYSELVRSPSLQISPDQYTPDC